MKAIIIEDEINVLEAFVKMLNTFLPQVEIMATANSISDGIEIIEANHFDILFLDINLPDGSGLDLIRKLDNIDFNVIFVTAYDQYAIDAFKLSAVDYLLKPVNPELLIQAVQKVAGRSSPNLNNQQNQIVHNLYSENKNQDQKIIIADKDAYRIIPLSDIVYCKADGAYTEFHLRSKKKIISSHNLKEYERLLDPFQFFRCHHSFLINLHEVEEVKKQDGFSIKLKSGHLIPVSTRRKKSLLEALNSLYLS